MKLGIMQPYLFPYLGYFDLINYSDKWIIFDTVQYIRRGWMNRNRILSPQDVWNYIKLNKLHYCSIYDTGIERTGCMFCMFGVHLEAQPNRFQLMKQTHPQLYKYCIDNLGIGKVLDFIDVDYK